MQPRAASEGRLVLATAGSVPAVNAGTGRLLWRRRLGFPTDTALTDGRIVVTHGATLGDTRDHLRAIDVQTQRP